MLVTCKLKGLDCANCASKIERGISKISGAKNVNVNFMTTKLSFEAEDKQVQYIMEQIIKVVQKIDSKVVLS